MNIFTTQLGANTVEFIYDPEKDQIGAAADTVHIILTPVDAERWRSSLTKALTRREIHQEDLRASAPEAA